MIEDFKAVIWKEWRETLLQYGSVRRWLLNMLLMVGVMGIFLPLQFGRMAVESLFLLMWMWMPLLSAIALIADSIAGERERHTLETLLASRLPDRAIVLGKMIVTVAQSWLMMLASAVIALITVNLFKSEGQLIMYPGPIAFGLVVLSLLAAILVAGVGVIASTHAKTVRQAYQRMSIPLVVVVVLPGLGLSMLPPDILSLFYSAEFAQNSLGGVLLMVALVLLVLDLGVTAVALQRFQRSRLITD